MLIKILGFADILAIFALLAANLLPQKLVILMAFYLIMKGLIFMLMGGSITNLIDMITGFYLILASFGVSHWILTIPAVLFLAQKAFVSLV